LPGFARRRCAAVVPGLELLAGFLMVSGHRLVPSYMWARQENPDTRDGTPGTLPKFSPPQLRAPRHHAGLTRPEPGTLTDTASFAYVYDPG